MHTHYDNLRVTRNATPGVIKAAYRALCQEYHPDRNSSPDATRIMAIINDAYTVLSDPAARARYDSKLDRDERHTRSAQQEAAHARREADASEAGHKRAAGAEQQHRTDEAEAAEQRLRAAELREQVRRENDAARRRREARQAARKRESEQPPKHKKDSKLARVAGGAILLLVVVGGVLFAMGSNTTPAARYAVPAVHAAPAAAASVLSVATSAPAVEQANSTITTSLTRQK